MRKFIICVLLFVLCFNLAGCNNNINNKEYKELTEKIRQDYTVTSKSNKLENFIEEYNIELTAKDVQYDMSNNLDKYFLVEGIAELSTYYNYGFNDLEKDYFCIRVALIEGKHSDSWYLYCNRKSFAILFDDLKENDSIRIIARCIIPSSVYDKNQGNLAQLKTLIW